MDVTVDVVVNGHVTTEVSEHLRVPEGATERIVVTEHLATQGQGAPALPIAPPVPAHTAPHHAPPSHTPAPQPAPQPGATGHTSTTTVHHQPGQTASSGTVATGQGHIMIDEAVLREKPDTDQKILGRMYDGTNLEILGHGIATSTHDIAQGLKDWTHVRVTFPGESRSTEGWVASRFVASRHISVVTSNATCYVTASSGLYLHHAIGLHSARVQPAALPLGTNLDILGSATAADTDDLAQGLKNWLRVRVASMGVEGWVASEYTSLGSSLLPTNIADLMPLIDQVSTATGLSPSLIAAMVWQESKGNRFAMSGAGAMGLMQLMPATAAGYGVQDNGNYTIDASNDNPIFDPKKNMMAGSQYLASLLLKFTDQQYASWGLTPEQLAVAAYNAGPGAVDHAHGIPRNAETQAYVPDVLGLHQQFSDALRIPGPGQLDASQPNSAGTALTPAPASGGTRGPAHGSRHAPTRPGQTATPAMGSAIGIGFVNGAIGAHLRSTPDGRHDSNIITTLKGWEGGSSIGGRAVEILRHATGAKYDGNRNDWYYVRVTYTGMEGWVDGELISRANPDVPSGGETCHVNVDGLSLRVGPDTGDKIIGLLSNGTVLTILPNNNLANPSKEFGHAWLNVMVKDGSYKGKTGWVDAYLTAPGEGSGTHEQLGGQYTDSGYPQDQCTYYAWHQWWDRLNIALVHSDGNALDWATNCTSAMVEKGGTYAKRDVQAGAGQPELHAIAVYPAHVLDRYDDAGHVAFVEQLDVTDDQGTPGILVSERNVPLGNPQNFRHVSLDEAKGLTFLYVPKAE